MKLFEQLDPKLKEMMDRPNPFCTTPPEKYLPINFSENINKMKALLIYGLKFGQDNQSLTDLGKKIAEAGHSVTFAHWNDKDVDILEVDAVIPHSFGIRMAMELLKYGKPIKYLAAIDPVFDWFPFNFSNYWKKFTIPSNVLKADCFQRSFPLIPPSGTIGNAQATIKYVSGLKAVYFDLIDPAPFRNYIGIPASHDMIPSHELVVNTILEALKSLEVSAQSY